MSAQISETEAFRFLDVRSPKATEKAHVLSRDKLGFPVTVLESDLLEAARDAGYYATVKAAVEKEIAASRRLDDAIFGDTNQYLSLFSDDEKSDEAKAADLAAAYADRRGGAGDNTYLYEPAAKAWDAYVASTILVVAGDERNVDIILRVAPTLRVAAALYAIQDGHDVELSPLEIATPAISMELFDAKLFCSQRPKPEKGPAEQREAIDGRARDRRSKLVQRFVSLELVNSELESLLSTKSISPMPSTAPAPAPAENEHRASPPLRVRFLTRLVSKSSLKLLTDEFGAGISGDFLDSLDLASTLTSIASELDSISSTLFLAAGQRHIVGFQRALPGWRQELATTGDLSPTTVAGISAFPGSYYPITSYPSSAPPSGIRPLGIGDLKVVKQTLLKYEMGEVAHVENVLPGEEKERVHSVRQKTEESITTERETSTSSERDLQTTDRFEIREEAAAATAEKQQHETGVTVSASYGAVSMSANTKFSDSSSSEQSSKISRNYAKEIVNRSVERVEQRVREERIRKTTLEIEETNRHLLSGKNGVVTGVYRWIEKSYWAQVNVYGKRLMLEFLVPEPAATYIHARLNPPEDTEGPPRPEPLILGPMDINRGNYARLAALYGAMIDAPPPAFAVSTFASRTHEDKDKTSISLPAGRVAVFGGAAASYIGPADMRMFVHIGTQSWDTSESATWPWKPLGDQATGDLPLLVLPFKVTQYNVAAMAYSYVSDTAMDQWRLSAYKALLDAYRIRKQEFDEYRESKKPSKGAPVAPDSSNRETERTELQRGCLELLTRQHFDSVGAVRDNPTTGWPEIQFADAGALGDAAAFFQHSFEWEQMTYVFYPYFWARQSEWQRMLTTGGQDEAFDKFLAAGYARVVVPVRPAHESDVLFYLQTGVRWNGTEPPVIGDPRYVDIIDEIKESLDAPDGGVPDGSPWQFRVPTSLVFLDASGKLPELAVYPGPAIPFIPSADTCGGLPYNLGQWKDAKSIADAFRLLGYGIDPKGDQGEQLIKGRAVIKSAQRRFNFLGVTGVIGRNLAVDGVAGPCTLRCLSYFVSMKIADQWPGPG